MKGHARNLMTDRVVSVTLETPLTEIGQTLVACGFGGVPVVDADQQVVGFIGQDDLLAALLRASPEAAAQEVTAGEVMSHPPIVVDEFMGTDEVLLLLREAGVHHLPVVRNGRLVGIITPHDVLKYYLEKILPPPLKRA